MRSAIPRSVVTGEAFWRFSLALYARPGVADALIGLQDRAGSDVNLILFGLWLGATRGRKIDTAELAAAAAAIAPLNIVVAQARALRRQLRDAPDRDLRELRRRVLSLELAAERRVQYRLAAFFTSWREGQAGNNRNTAVQANLAQSLGDEADSSEAAALSKAVVELMRNA